MDTALFGMLQNPYNKDSFLLYISKKRTLKIKIRIIEGLRKSALSISEYNTDLNCISQ
jgi:hypothetical protein